MSPPCMVISSPASSIAIGVCVSQKMAFPPGKECVAPFAEAPSCVRVQIYRNHDFARTFADIARITIEVPSRLVQGNKLQKST